jgi:hypothetical protein
MKPCSSLLYNNINTYTRNQILDRTSGYGGLFDYKYPIYFTNSVDDQETDNTSKDMRTSSKQSYTQEEEDAATAISLDELETEENPLLQTYDFTDHTSDTRFTEEGYLVKHLGEVLPGYFLAFKFLSIPSYDSEQVSFQYTFGLEKYLGGGYDNPDSYSHPVWFQASSRNEQEATFTMSSNI